MRLVCLLAVWVVNCSHFFKTTYAIECHCKSGGCDKNNQCRDSSGCERGWSGSLCQRYNLALDKNTLQSSTADDCIWKVYAPEGAKCGLKNSSLAVDGRRSTDYWSGTCTHTTMNQNEAWWSVDLGGMYQIYHIQIYFPTAKRERMKDFRITVDDWPCYTWTSLDTPAPPLSVHCTTPMNGTHVKITAYQKDFFLNLCEVEVYECADGVFGEQCSSLCNCKNKNEVCDKVTGRCQSECVDGYTGEDCQTQCQGGHYGAGCKEECGQCAGSDTCDHVTGNCPGGCLVGWAGDQCKGSQTTFALECHCKSGGCDKNNQCRDSSGCERGWSGSLCQRYNLALDKDTLQSSTVDDCKWKKNAKGAKCGLKNSSLAVDGRRSTDYWSGTCTHTAENQTEAWWSVDLGGMYQIYHILIYFPSANRVRMKDFRITVDGRPCYTWTNQDTLAPPLSVHCTTPMNGRHVKIRAYQKKLILNLCEVEVYECADGVFGEQCSSLCNCKNENEVCDKVTGRCKSGCVHGYTGEDCQTRSAVECADDQFGPPCENCGQCSGTRFCDKETGNCPSGCLPGWRLDRCQQKCQGGHYGAECKEECGQCDGSDTCDHVTGNCPGRCLVDWAGDQCKECVDGKFGTDCSYSCNCKNKEVCNKITGECNSGCSDGYTGSHCHTQCQGGHYGAVCNEQCGQCAWSDTCDHVTGNCPRGCIAHWAGYQCKACSSDRFGDECKQTCGRCSPWYKSPSRKCHAVTGHCKGSCESNWSGVQCKECMDGKFGAWCSSSCNCKITNEVCIKTTGHCNSGCSDGYTGEGCIYSCTVGFYGFGCNETCGHCRRNECNYVNGTCSGGCKNNWTGDRCKECQNGKFGDQCTSSCKCKNSSEVCNKKTGHCNSGCRDGFKGVGCQQECPDGQYGNGCKKSCGNCKYGNNDCNHVNGKCTHGCKTRWKGDRCKECEDFKFGPQCNKKCACKDPSEVCNKTTGDCVQSGCKDGLTGLDCQTTCADGTYGFNCEKQCGRCREGRACRTRDGYCSSGCVDGFQPSLCDDCFDRRFGSNCTNSCNCRNSTEVCDKTTGQCTESGCQEGWTGLDCLKQCEDGTYGYSCTNTCGQCLGGEVCTKTDGKCSSGCDKGYQEPFCKDCTDGYYGGDCTSCGLCFDNTTCNKQTGLCKEGCQSGWKGDNCHEACVGTYGYNCNETCGQCLGGASCHPQTGKCPGDCHPDYEGPGCLALKASPPSSVLTVVVVVVIFVLLLLVLVGIVVYRRRNRNEDQTPVVMSALREDNTNDASLGEQAPQRPSPYRKAATTDDQEDTYVNVASTVVKVRDLHQYIRNRVDMFASEYLRFRKGLQFPHKVAGMEGNGGKNRFKQMYPYDHSRVVLVKLPTVQASDYINASYINGYKAKRQYIAAQGPNSLTVGDFWRMVWQEKSPIIVMLTRLTEGRRDKCAEYWPQNGGSMVSGDLQVTNKSTLQKADFVIREFTVHHTKIDQRHHVTQLHFMSWPDHGVPSDPALVRFWKLFRSLVTSKTGPFIVHCSAGVGRTGTFIALDSLVKQAKESGKLNVFEFVSKMRESRVSMVQTKEQYFFLHTVVLEALRSESTHMTPATFDSRFNSDALSSPEDQAVLQEEWKNIKDLQSTLTDKEVAASLLEANIKKSRMKEHFPPDALRPKLETPVPDTNDYINAVFIPSEYNGQGIVVTQLPLPWTVVDFWRLVLDHNIKTVVCLEPLQQEKPDDEGTYWPETRKEMFSDPFIVSKVATRTRQISDVSLQVWQKESAESTKHDVNLLFMGGWDGSKDTPTNTSTFLQLVSQVGMQESSSPVVVMCRNGSTRCGLFCAVLNIIQRLKSDSEIDIYLLIRQLRTIRPGFIRSYEQYRFCYQMIKEYQDTVNAVYENL